MDQISWGIGTFYKSNEFTIELAYLWQRYLKLSPSPRVSSMSLTVRLVIFTSQATHKCRMPEINRDSKPAC